MNHIPTNPAPVILTTVPPFREPLFGVTDVIDGRRAKVVFSENTTGSPWLFTRTCKIKKDGFSRIVRTLQSMEQLSGEN